MSHTTFVYLSIRKKYTLALSNFQVNALIFIYMTGFWTFHQEKEASAAIIPWKILDPPMYSMGKQQA